jgi:putative flippase GtrA
MSAKLISSPRLQVVRYGTAISLGFAIDFGITLALSRLAGLDLRLSAALGFLVALAFNYMLFEFWVFRSGQPSVSATRLSQTLLAAGAALSMRVGVIWLVGKILGDTLPEVVATVLLGAAASFLVNYTILRLVFARRATAVLRMPR